LACHLQIDADPNPDSAYQVDADPYADTDSGPDPAYHFDANPDADPDPTFQFDSDPVLLYNTDVLRTFSLPIKAIGKKLPEILGSKGRCSL
jgi:hypothetical protein